jgi:FAD/FMN-containing dehydrogenase
VSTDPALVRRLVDVVGADHVLADDDVTAGYRTDWTGRFVSPPSVVVRPGSTEEVAAVVETCRSSGAALVPQGGNTGLVGGGIPLHGEVVLSLRRLDRISEVDADSGQIVAGAGTTIGSLQATAAEQGWAYAVDLASRDSATIGGTIATNAGGLRVLRYGDTRAQVMGVEAVLGDGRTVTALSGLYRNNTGYHLPSLFCGSEGTLGVVTAARVRLARPPTHRVAALVAFTGVDAALAAAVALRRTVPTLEAVELMVAAGIELVCEVRGFPRPFPEAHPAYLLVETAGPPTSLDDLDAGLASVAGIADAAVADDAARRRSLWRYRESHTEAINTVGTPHKLDLALPLPELPAFVDRLPAQLATVAPGARLWLFGHVADGNLHVNVTGVADDDYSLDEAVFHLVAEHHGSISAEHGIGTAKRRWVSLSRTADELAAFRSLKTALDPDGILNPHVLLPAVGS